MVFDRCLTFYKTRGGLVYSVCTLMHSGTTIPKWQGIGTMQTNDVYLLQIFCSQPALIEEVSCRQLQVMQRRRDENEYGLLLTDSQEYGLSLTDLQEYGLSLTDSHEYGLLLTDSHEYGLLLTRVLLVPHRFAR